MIYRAIAVIVFIMITGVLGFDHWGTQPWWEGFGMMVALAIVWHTSESTKTVLSIVGVLIFGATLLGVANDLTANSRAFFNGGSIGFMIGLAISAWWHWATFRPKLVALATMEDVGWLLRLLGEKNGKA